MTRIARQVGDFRRCPRCKGAGEVTRNASRCDDPQQDYGVRCGQCCGEGWIPFRTPDPLEFLANRRRLAVLMPHYRVGVGHPSNRDLYRALRARLADPVHLP